MSLSSMSSAAAFTAATTAVNRFGALRPLLVLVAFAAVAPSIAGSAASASASASVSKPYLIELRREVYPVRRAGKIVSYKASYSGPIHVGYPVPQRFTVVFDTGSGHVIVPSVDCQSAACMQHRRYDMHASNSSEAIDLDGQPLKEGQLTDQVTIGFGTGRVTGEFVRDVVCFGAPPEEGAVAQDDPEQPRRPCASAQVVMATDMSRQPFQFFEFDGIMGLGLHSLALSKNFSMFDILAGSGQMAASQFAIYLTEGETEGDSSELAIGGYNPRRFSPEAGPIVWASIVQPELGYWLLNIVAFRVDGKKLDLCDDGSCRGILDTGTSHLGIPGAANAEVASLLTRSADGLEDCRLSDAPEVEIELGEPGNTVKLKLHAEDYMRKLPLPKELSVDSSAGVSPTSHLIEAPAMPPPGANVSTGAQAAAINGTENHTAMWEKMESMEKLCRPKLMPVNMPKPVGPNLFILGEPLLQRYYTVFDWSGPRAGFGLSSKKSVGGGKAKAKPKPVAPQPLEPVREDAVFLTQLEGAQVHEH